MKRQRHPVINRLIFGLALGAVLCGAVPCFAVITPDATRPQSRLNAMQTGHQFQQAATLLESQWQKAPNDPSVGPQLLRLRLILNQSEAAEAMVETAKATHPQHSTTWLLWAMASYGLAVDQDDPNRESRALEGLNALQGTMGPMDETNPTAQYIQGLTQSLNGNMEAAEVAFLKTLHLSPNHTLALQGLSDVYLSQKQKKLAVPLLQQLLELAPDDVDTLFLMGRLYFEKENPEQALIQLNQSQQADTMVRPRRLLLQAECYRLLGKQGEAIAAFEGVLKAWPQRADLWVKLGHLYDASGDTSAGLRAFQTAYRLQPEILNPFITEALATLWNESPQKAAPLLDRLPLIAPDRSDLLQLAVENHMWTWAEAMPVSQSTLNDLTECLAKFSENNADLVISAIQLEILRNHGLTEGLQTVLSDLDVSGSATASVQKALLLNQPMQAQAALTQIPAERVDPILIARSALWGMGHWAQGQVTMAPDLAPMAPTLQQWTQSQTRLYRAAWTNALLFVRAKQYPQAQEALKVMRHHQPLSAPAQLLYAEIAAQQEDLDALGTSLTNAEGLGVTTTQERQTLERLRKILDTLQKREDALAKPTPAH